MEYRVLGQTGVQVSALCPGAMNFGSFANRDHDDCLRIMHTAFDAGVNFVDAADVYFVDAADVYSQGESEEIVAAAVKGRRDKIVIATKQFHPMGPDVNQHGIVAPGTDVNPAEAGYAPPALTEAWRRRRGRGRPY